MKKEISNLLEENLGSIEAEVEHFELLLQSVQPVVRHLILRLVSLVGSRLPKPLNPLSQILGVLVKLLFHVLEPVERLEPINLIEDLEKVGDAESETVV